MLQKRFWSFNHNVTRDQVCSLMNASFVWFIWHLLEERTYLAYCLFPSRSLEERPLSSECFLSSFLYLLAALGGNWAATTRGVVQRRLLVRACVCSCGEVRWNGWTTLSCKAAVLLLKPAIPVRFMLHQQMGRSVFVRRLWARACPQKEECSATEREWWWKLGMYKLQKMKLKKYLPAHENQEHKNEPWNTFWWPTNEKSLWESLQGKLQRR